MRKLDRTAVTFVLAGLLALSTTASASAALRPRPSDVPPSSVETEIVPNDFQVFNDYATPERRHSSARAVVHYVVLGIDAPPLNDDDVDGVPDYVERVGEAADIAIAYYERRGFRVIRPDTGGSDSRPDLYISRFAPGSFGISFPAADAQGGAFAAVANNLDPSRTYSLASLYATVAHELFHLVQFSYYPASADPDLPGWVLEGSAGALENRVNPELDDIVAALQLREWFAAADQPITSQTYGARLLWQYLDETEPRLLPAVLTRLSAKPVSGEGRAAFAQTFRSVTGAPFAQAFLRYAVRAARAFPQRIRPRRIGRTVRAKIAPFAVHYRAVSRPSAVVVRFARRPAAAALTYEVASDIAGNEGEHGRIDPVASRGGLTLTFRVPRALRRNPRFSPPLLILTNGRASGVLGYTVSVR